MASGKLMIYIGRKWSIFYKTIFACCSFISFTIFLCRFIFCDIVLTVFGGQLCVNSIITKMIYILFDFVERFSIIIFGQCLANLQRFSTFCDKASFVNFTPICLRCLKLAQSEYYPGYYRTKMNLYKIKLHLQFSFCSLICQFYPL